MLNISNELKDKFKHDYYPYIDEPMEKEISIIFDDESIPTITWDKIVTNTVSLTESICSTDNLEFGACESSMFKCTVANIDTDITDKVITVQLTIGNETINYGKFKIASALKQDNMIFKDIIAYDLLQMFNIDVSMWYNGLPWETSTITLKDFRDSLCSLIGIVQEEITLVNDSMEVEKTLDTNDLNGLNVLRKICQINGCFGHMGRDGKLQYKYLYHTYGLSFDEELELSEELELRIFTDYETILPYRNSDEYEGSINPSVHYEEYVTPAIDKICIIGEEGEVGTYCGDGTNCYYIKDNFLLYGKTSEELKAILSNVAELIMDRPYKPFNATLYGMPYLEVGDVIFDSNSGYITYCLERTLTGEQSLRDSISANGQPKLKQDTNTNSEIIKLKQRSAKITKELEEVSVELSDYENDTDSTLAVYLQEILLRVKKGDVSSQISVESDIIDIAGPRLRITTDYFQLDENGKIHATGGEFSGDITASSININNTFVVNKVTGKVSIVGNGMFELNMDSIQIINGKLKCIDGEFTGKVTSTGTKGTSTLYDGGFIYTLGDFTVSIQNGQLYVMSGNGIIGNLTQIGAGAVDTYGINASGYMKVNNYDVITTNTIEQYITQPSGGNYATQDDISSIWEAMGELWGAINS